MFLYGVCGLLFHHVATYSLNMFVGTTVLLVMKLYLAILTPLPSASEDKFSDGSTGTL